MSEIKVLCQEQGYNEGTMAFLDAQWQKVKDFSEGYAVFAEQLKVYKNNITGFEHEPMLDKVHEIGDTVGIGHNTMDLMLLVFMLPILKEQYVEQKLPMRYYEAVVGTVRNGAEKSFERDGVAAASTAWWNMSYFKLEMFRIGRLIFRWRPFKASYAVGDVVIEKGTYRIEVHIPSGAPLIPEAVNAAYDEAKPFFEARYNKKDLLFSCSSWLLSPTLDELLPPTSNILAFAHGYTIIKTSIDPTGERAGHFIFGAGVDMTNVDALPENSTLHRGIKARLKAGKGVGHALGVILPKK